MNFLTKVAVLGLVLTTAACTRPDRFGAGDGAGAGANGQIDPNAGMTGASDPRSPLYFNQTIGDRVLFTIDTSTLTDEGKSILNGQASWLQTNSDYLAIIEGHADEQGTREYNIGLGFRRANAVREYLVSQGVPTNRLRVTSYGKERPIQVCSQESCYAQNRRAVTVISIASLS
ncbi:peptidoglycan-associated lipoprotein Pal [Yoonia sp. MH D7]